MALLFHVDPAISIAVLLGLTVSWILSRASASRSIPKVGSSESWVASRKDFAHHGMDIIQKGFDHVKSGVFRVTSLDGKTYPSTMPYIALPVYDAILTRHRLRLGNPRTKALVAPLQEER